MSLTWCRSQRHKSTNEVIQPENLLMTTKGPDALLKLADFGISKILSEEMLNTNCGTPIYMAPEIWTTGVYN